jgi:hypothetical protein
MSLEALTKVAGLSLFLLAARRGLSEVGSEGTSYPRASDAE